MPSEVTRENGEKAMLTFHKGNRKSGDKVSG